LKEDNDFLRALDLNIEQITHLYRNNNRYIDNYNAILSYIEKLKTQNKNISLIVPGNPRLGVTITQIIKKFFNESKEIKFDTIPGISSFVTMYNDLNIDPLEKGTILVDVNRLLLYEYNIDTALNYFIYHICSIGNPKTNYKNPTKDNKVCLLKEYLLRFYNPEHKICMIESAGRNLETPSLREFTITEIEKLLENVNFNSTLFIQGIKKQTLNKNFGI